MKKVVLIVLPLIVILGTGTVLGLGYLGILKLPFFPHKKPVKKAGKQAVAAAPPAAPKKPAATPPPVDPPKPKSKPKPKVVVVPPDVEAGEKKLAAVWNAMDAAQLEPIVKDWKDPDLARILVKMDADKVTELLAALDPNRASTLSRAIEKEAAKPKPVDG